LKGRPAFFLEKLKKTRPPSRPGRAALTPSFCKIIIKLRGHPDVAVVARNDGGDMVNGLNVDEG
jgi:hypothetical protein